MIHVSFQGERGAYSEAAARSFFNEEIEDCTSNNICRSVREYIK